MKTTALLLVILALISCKKDDDAPNDPVPPYSRNLFAEFNGGDTSAVRVFVASATRPRTEYHWTGSPFALALDPGGQQASVYRGDTLLFFGATDSPCDVTVRLSDLGSSTFHLEAANNGVLAHSFIANW